MATADRPDIVNQDETRCRILGVDEDGWTHVYDTRRRRIVVISKLGIDTQQQLRDRDDLGDWMRFVDSRRGWLHEQWDGYRLAEVFSGP